MATQRLQDSNHSFLVNRTENPSFLQTADAICRHVTPGLGFHYASSAGPVDTLDWGEDKHDKIAGKLVQLHGVLYGLDCYDGILKTGKMACSYKTIIEEEEKSKVDKDEEMQGEIRKLLMSQKSNLTFLDSDLNQTASMKLFTATSITCFCDAGYYLTNNGCEQCKEDSYGGGGEKKTCTQCPEGTTTMGEEGATRAKECCRQGNEVKSLGMCVSSVFLVAFIFITMVVAAFIITCGFAMVRDGKDAVDSSEHYPQCRIASRSGSVMFRAASFAVQARASLLNIVVRPTTAS